MLKPVPEPDPELATLLMQWPYGATFDLPPGATVVVAGAYKGRVMRLLDNLYDIKRLVGFEPQPWAYAESVKQKRTLQEQGRGDNWELMPYAIGIESGEFPMYEWGTDGCSFVDNRREMGVGKMQNISNAFRMLDLDRIDLCVFNMEGYEYILVPYLLNNPDILVSQFAIQWHTFAEATPAVAGMVYDTITAQFTAMGYHLKYDHFPQWTLWSL